VAAKRDTGIKKAQEQKDRPYVKPQISINEIFNPEQPRQHKKVAVKPWFKEAVVKLHDDQDQMVPDSIRLGVI